MDNTSVGLEDAKRYLQALDLGYLVETMCSSRYPLPRWTKKDAEIAVRLYKNFLLLQKIHDNELLVPTREIDECWHNHILHTKRYFHDCLQIFGYYLHHLPAMPDDDPKLLLEQYQKTKNYYLKQFNEPLQLNKM